MSLILQMISYKKGDGNTYFPIAGESCLISGPHCDDENGYTFDEYEVLWTDDTFIVYRKPGCWPVVNKWEHIRCRKKDVFTSDGKEPNCDNCRNLEPGMDGDCWKCDQFAVPPSEWIDIKDVPEESPQ